MPSHFLAIVSRQYLISTGGCILRTRDPVEALYCRFSIEESPIISVVDGWSLDLDLGVKRACVVQSGDDIMLRLPLGGPSVFQIADQDLCIFAISFQLCISPTRLGTPRAGDPLL